MSNIIEEGYIKNSPIPVPLKGIEKILEQMKNFVCKLKMVIKMEQDFFHQ